MSEIKTPPTSDDLVDIGETHHKAGRLQDAEAYYRKALDLDPSHPGALYYLANITFADGRFDAANALLEELLREEPADAEAWHLLGMIAMQRQDGRQASEYFKKALTLQPNYVQAHFSLGNALASQGNIDAALASFQRAIALNPDFCEAHFLIGNALRILGKLDDAISSYQRAIKANPYYEPAYIEMSRTFLTLGKSDEAISFLNKAIEQKTGGVVPHTTLGHLHFTNNNFEAAARSYRGALELDSNCYVAHNGLGNTYYNWRQFDKAIEPYERAFAINPNDLQMLENFAVVLSLLDKHEKAIEIYKQLLVLKPDHPTARHHLAAYTNESVPTRADDAYVERTFDAFAENFDQILTDLRYQAPQLIKNAIQRECDLPNEQLAILDAGCGTGLCGPLIRAYASSLIGVDLSEGMLEKAKLHNVYDNLVKAELTSYLESQTQAFDIILSADTLVYFGELSNVFIASHSALRNAGYLFFTVEALSHEPDGGTGYFLNSHGRYSHSETYIRQTLARANFTIIAMEGAILRYQGDLPVHGFVVSCRALM